MLASPDMARLLIVEDNHELASLIESFAESRGHTAVAVHRGDAAMQAAQEATYAAAVVDLLLPDMRGGVVLRHLHERNVPAIAISGVFKGDRFAKEAVTSHGAVAFFEKPFDMRALFEALEKAAGVELDEPLGAMPNDEEELEELSPIEEEEDEPFIAPPPAVEARRRAPELTLPFAERKKVWAEAAPAPAAPAKPPAAPAKPPVAAAKPPASPDWSHAGNLATSSVPKLLTAFYQAKHSGELKLRQGQVIKIVDFEDGQPIYAASNLAHERFARFCVRKGLIPESVLPKVAALTNEGMRTGEAMLHLQLITPEQRKGLLEDQIREIIWSTFTWTAGQFRFLPRRALRADMVKLKVFPGDLILEGVQRLPLVALRQRMPASRKLFPCAEPPYAVNEIRLSGAQAKLLAHTDGTKTVEDLVALEDLPERETLAALVGFEALGMVVERSDETKRQRISFGF